MKKAVSKVIWAILVGMLAVSLFSGCASSAQNPGGSASEAVDTAIIALQGDGIPMIENASELVGNVSVSYGGSAALIIADGAPTLYGPVRFQEQKKNEIQQQRLEAQYRADIAAAIQGAAAQTPETDLLTALTLAGRAVNSGTAENKNIIVCHSGITTASNLPMQLNLLSREPEQLAEQLEASDMIPNLEGIQVDFYGLGDTAGSQEALSAQQIQWLRQFWQAFFDRSGAQVVFHPDVISGAANQANGHTVTPLAAEGELDFMAITSEQIAFRPDSTMFVDEQAADRVLEKLARKMAGGSGSYVIAGSTARVDASTEEGAKTLSLARAQAVCRILCEKGIDAQRLSCVGLGNQPTSCRSAEEAENRCVYIVSSSRPEAAEFLSVAAGNS